MASKKNRASKASDRRARIAEMRRAEQARERVYRNLTIGAVALVVVATLIGGYFVWSATNDDGKQAEASKESAPPAQIKGEKTWGGLSQEHVSEDVDYPMSPGAGGPHNEVWADCEGSVYGDEVPEENAVHSLEHGAVWVTYTDKVSDADVDALKERVSSTPYSLMSPYPDQSSPITLTAWGHQLGVKRASDPRVKEFFELYVQGEQTPEPGATCTSELRP